MLPNLNIPGEQELAVMTGDEPGTSLRLVLTEDGQVRVEQLAYTASVGWHVQKTLLIPRGTLSALGLHMRKLDCVLPRSDSGSNPWLFPGCRRSA